MSAYKKIDYQYTPEEKQMYWKIGTGLQAVDGLTTSKYLDELQHKEIHGDMNFEEVEENLKEYYRLEESLASQDTKEADIVATRITQYLQESQFNLHPRIFKQIHKALFFGLDDFNAGEYRGYNFSKEEPILYGRSVRYEDYRNIDDYLEYDMEKEAKKSGLRSIDYIANFISGVWQIHPFEEGNTRTTAVFTIQYLNSLGYDINNIPFQQNAKYFRNALVRACYNDIQNSVSPDFQYLNRFFENVMFGKDYDLKSEDLIVSALQRNNEPKFVQEHLPESKLFDGEKKKEKTRDLER